MSLSETFLLSIAILFALNLLVLIAYIGPILQEVTKILKDARSMTHTVSERVAKVDRILDNTASVMGAVSGFNRMRQFFVRRKAKKSEDSD